MAKHFPLQTLLDLSQMRMDEAARRLGELLAALGADAAEVDAGWNCCNNTARNTATVSSPT